MRGGVKHISFISLGPTIEKKRFKSRFRDKP
jgi:hypothetical protein